MDRLFLHKGRHVVAATGDEVEGKLPVKWVGLYPTVEGVSKRGRRPRYTTGVDVTELTEITDQDVVAQFATAPASETSSS